MCVGLPQKPSYWHFKKIYLWKYGTCDCRCMWNTVIVFCRLLAVPSSTTAGMWPEHAKSCICTVIQQAAQLECTAVIFRVSLSMARATSLLSMYPKQTTQVSTLPLASVSDCTLLVSINHTHMLYFPWALSHWLIKGRIKRRGHATSNAYCVYASNGWWVSKIYYI